MQDVTDFENLYVSHLKAQHGVIWKDSVAWYSLHGLEQTLKLSDELKSGTYRPKPATAFQITKPKKRDIVAVPYRDRVYQRTINDLILYPKMTESFIKENGACQIGKGVDYERDIFRKYLRRSYIQNGLNGWFLQIDIKGYYPSLDHETVESMFRSKLDDDTYHRVKNVLNWQYPGDKGYNPGSQMVQIAGISFLCGVDHFVKEKLHVKNYVRYMDDMVLILNSKEEAERCLTAITEELSKLKLKTNPKKTNIFPVTDGIEFLGFVWNIGKTGEVYMIPKSATIKTFKQQTKALDKLVSKGERTKESLGSSIQTRLSYISKGKTYNLNKKLKNWCEKEIKNYDLPPLNTYSCRKGRTRQCKGIKHNG